MSNTPLPPEGCTCASFWTVRGTHKKDCPLSTTEPPKTLEQILNWLSPGSAAHRKAQVLTEIQALIEAVIGEDEDLYFGKPHGFNDNFSFNDSANIRNKFRAEQRLRLSKLIRKGEL